MIEETPPPDLTDDIRARLWDAAIRVGTLVKYQSAGTIEFVYDRTSHEVYFPDVNCRLQVIKKKNFEKYRNNHQEKYLSSWIIDDLKSLRSFILLFIYKLNLEKKKKCISH
jgi:hypothetical protein